MRGVLFSRVDYGMTVTLSDRNAVADLLDHVAELVRQDKIEGLSIAMVDGKTRVSVTFAPGHEQDLVSKELEEADTRPGIKIDRKALDD